MMQLLASSGTILFGLMLLTIGNGVQGTLLGVRAELEGFSTLSIAVIMSSYYIGFLGGSWLTTSLVLRVGHVRVFAALGSFISAALLLFPMITDPIVWMLLRVALGFCFSGVYVTAESWLNNNASNETRGKAFAAYMMVQMIGLVAAQWILSLGDPSGFILFIIPSVLVSISFAPILLSVDKTPPFETTKRMSLKELLENTPLACVGVFLLGSINAAQISMSAIYGARAGLSNLEIYGLVASFYLGAMIVQLPLGWVSDRMDRRRLITIVTSSGVMGCALGYFVLLPFEGLLLIAFLVGGTTNPVYSLLIAHAGDYLEPDQHTSASSGLVFLNGVGAIGGPIMVGWLLSTVGAGGFWLLQGVMLFGIALYALYRTTRRASVAVEDTASYVPLVQTASPIASEITQEIAIEMAEEAADQAPDDLPTA